MGGQACVFYGAAEFSRDLDLLLLLAPDNLDRLRERRKDREYWAPLKSELEQLRRASNL
jgi:PHD/YefM family antitoxin component YafN of YafNO toxin-antitoxin module